MRSGRCEEGGGRGGPVLGRYNGDRLCLTTGRRSFNYLNCGTKKIGSTDGWRAEVDGRALAEGRIDRGGGAAEPAGQAGVLHGDHDAAHSGDQGVCPPQERGAGVFVRAAGGTERGAEERGFELGAAVLR